MMMTLVVNCEYDCSTHTGMYCIKCIANGNYLFGLDIKFDDSLFVFHSECHYYGICSDL